MKDPIIILKSVLNSLREPLFILSPDNRCVFANEALFKFLGIEREGRSVLPIQEFWPQSNFEFPSEEFSCDFKTAKETFTVKLATSSLEDSYTMVKVLAGHSKKEALTKFHTQRLETLGMLAGGVAHDFNNVLAGILGHVTFLKTILPQKGAHIESLSAVEEGGKKASIMTQQILNFSRVESSDKPARINLNEFVVRICSLLRGAISTSYSLTQGLLPEPHFVLASEGNLAQVIVNLVINARDALSEKGSIHVELGVESEPRFLKSLFKGKDLAVRRFMRLTVRDNGHGMSPEVKARMFEPYFSTKKEKGTGLGLATVNAIVRSIGGAIEVQSVEGEGTSVSVYIPEAEIPVAKPPSIEESAESRRSRRNILPGGDERILIVDDEFPVRNVLQISLQHLGYKIDAASSGVEALELFKKNKGEYDLVILDMLMPQMSGEETFFKLKAQKPNVRVLSISGYTSEESVKNILSNGGIDFIQKPFTIEELSKKVRECVDVDAT